VLVSLARPATAAADWFAAPFLGIKFAGSTSFVDFERGASNTRMTLGASGGFLDDEIFGVEGEFGYSPRFFERSSAVPAVARSNVTTLMGNVLFALPTRISRDGLRPYATVGFGLVHVRIENLADLLPVDSNLFGMSIGGGAIGRLTARTSLRFDLRHIRNLSRGNGNEPTIGEPHISYWRLTAGVVFSPSLF
jgi:hypothetical protein